MEFNLGRVKLLYDIDDGNMYTISKKIMDIVDSNKVIIVTDIITKDEDSSESHYNSSYFKDIKRAIDNLFYLNTGIYVIIAKLSPIADNAVDYNLAMMKDAYFMQNLKFFDITTLCDSYDPDVCRFLVYSKGWGEHVINYCKAKVYMEACDYSLLPICQYHINGLIEGGYLNDTEVDINGLLAAELNNSLEQVIHDFNEKYANNSDGKIKLNKNPFNIIRPIIVVKEDEDNDGST